MHPELFHIGKFTMYSWGFMLALGVIAAVSLLWILCKYHKIDEKIYDFYFWNGVVAIAFGLLGAWAFQKVYDAIAGKPFVWGGFTFMGGLVCGAASFVLGTAFFAKQPAKNEFYRIANFAAPCVVLAHAFGRIGCFLAGCCYGIKHEHGMNFPGVGRVLPTQLYEAIFLFALFGVMMFCIFYVKKYNFLLIAYGIVYAIFRFVIEFYRGDYRGGAQGAALSPSQWQSILFVLAAGALAVLVYYKKIIPFYKPAAAVDGDLITTGKPEKTIILEETTGAVAPNEPPETEQADCSKDKQEE